MNYFHFELFVSIMLTLLICLNDLFFHIYPITNLLVQGMLRSRRYTHCHLCLFAVKDVPKSPFANLLINSDIGIKKES